jgi:ribosomal protein S18 acetylase RimI-like enzyme
MLVGWEGRVTSEPDVTVAATPTSPAFYYGNFLLYPAPPAAGDRERWEARFAAAFPDVPGLRHRCFRWDRPDGARGELDEFVAAGYTVDETVVLTAERTRLPRPPAEAELRVLVGDADWEAATRLQVTEAVTKFGERAADFARDQLRRYRRFAEAGRGFWMGAFVDGELAADLGVFVQRGVARYQAVETAPGFRRRGLCATLVDAAARHAHEAHAARLLVMLAAPAEPAIRVYESLGFARREALVSVWHAG